MATTAQPDVVTAADAMAFADAALAVAGHQVPATGPDRDLLEQVAHRQLTAKQAIAEYKRVHGLLA